MLTEQEIKERTEKNKEFAVDFCKHSLSRGGKEYTQEDLDECVRIWSMPDTLLMPYREDEWEITSHTPEQFEELSPDEYIGLKGKGDKHHIIESVIRKKTFLEWKDGTYE